MRLVKAVFGYAIAAAGLVWIFRDVRIRELADSMIAIQWWWVAGAVCLDILSYVCQGMRWRLLLHPLGRVSTVQATEAIYAGLFVNEILPMRMGEVLRTYLVSRRIRVRMASVIPSILVERLFDAIWLALAFGLTVFAVPLPRFLVDAEEILGFIALATSFLFIMLMFKRRGGSPARRDGVWKRWRPIQWVSGILNRMAGGIQDIGRSRFFYSSFGISIFLLVGQILAYWFVMQAYGLNLSFWHGAAIFLIVHVGTIVPGPPSNVGTYQFFTVVGLTLFGIDKTLATSFSIVVFFILTIPLWIFGLAVFSHLGLSVKKVRTEIAELAKD
jgi:uncharacterized protein (TIRG00374 family)